MLLQSRSSSRAPPLPLLTHRRAIFSRPSTDVPQTTLTFAPPSALPTLPSAAESPAQRQVIPAALRPSEGSAFPAQHAFFYVRALAAGRNSVTASVSAQTLQPASPSGHALPYPISQVRTSPSHFTASTSDCGALGAGRRRASAASTRLPRVVKALDPVAFVLGAHEGEHPGCRMRPARVLATGIARRPESIHVRAPHFCPWPRLPRTRPHLPRTVHICPGHCHICTET